MDLKNDSLFRLKVHKMIYYTPCVLEVNRDEETEEGGRSEAAGRAIVLERGWEIEDEFQSVVGKGAGEVRPQANKEGVSKAAGRAVVGGRGLRVYRV